MSMDLYLTITDPNFDFTEPYDRFEIKTCYAALSDLYGPTYCLSYDVEVAEFLPRRVLYCADE